MDCNLSQVSGKEIAQKIEQSLAAGNLNAALETTDKALASCVTNVQTSIADEAVKALEDKSLLPKVVLTFAKDNFYKLSEPYGGDDRAIDRVKLESVLHPFHWEPAPPPMEQRIISKLEKDLSKYSSQGVVGTYVFEKDLTVAIQNMD
jgi:hypothetical protein